MALNINLANMKIVILDGFTTNPGDLSWESISSLGQTSIWDRTDDADLIDRAEGAQILVVNKRILGRKELSQLPDVQCICTLATGYNVIDINYCRENNITVCNAVGYSSESVAQHVFAMILHHYSNLGKYLNLVNQGKWSASRDWTFHSAPLVELSQKVIGIYGYGKIGKAVSKVARGFGMKVAVKSRGKEKDTAIDVTYLNEKEFFESCDIISLHAPLTKQNHLYINEEKLSWMKKTAILINTSRGGVINEPDLKDALSNGIIAAAYLDVLSEEPPAQGHILENVKGCFITPHIAWATKESRTRLIETVAENIKAFLKGSPQNIVV